MWFRPFLLPSLYLFHWDPGGRPLLVCKLMLGRLTNPVKPALSFWRRFKAQREQQFGAVCFPLSQPGDG